MIYKKIVNNVPSLSSLLLAGMVFGGCKDEKGAANNTDPAEEVKREQADASVSSSNAKAYDYEKVSNEHLIAFISLAKECIMATELHSWLPNMPEYLSMADFSGEGKEDKGKKEVKKDQVARLNEAIAELSTWGTSEWKDAFLAIQKLKFKSASQKGELVNKIGWVKGIERLAHILHVLSKACVAFLNSDLDAEGLAKLREEVVAVMNTLASDPNYFSEDTKFYNSERPIPFLNGSKLAKSIIKFSSERELASNSSVSIWLSKTSQSGTWLTGTDEIKVKNPGLVVTKQYRLPAIAKVSFNKLSSVQLLKATQLVYDLFFSEKNNKTGLAFIDVADASGEVDLTSKGDVFANVFELAQDMKKSGEFATALAGHINGNSTLKDRYSVEFNTQVLNMLRAINEEIAREDTGLNLAGKLEEFFKAALNANVTLKSIKDKAKASNTEADIDNLSNATLMEKVCCKIAHAIDYTAANTVANASASMEIIPGYLPSLPSDFDAMGNSTGVQLKNAIMKDIIEPVLNGLIVKVDVNNIALDANGAVVPTYVATAATNFVKDQIIALGDAFSKARKEDEITYKGMRKASKGKFDIDKLSKLPKDANDLFSFVFTDLHEMVFGSKEAGLSDDIKKLIPVEAKQKNLFTKIKATQDRLKAAPAA